ncbi:hypothetical protein [Pseudomonas aeruginosa]|uniref:hypothetical protein n=1 Tax=Pseudomonas aeruginosa TaxID=287 RepID=UPI00071B3326|nr:hypothetical protein [Pseudomonas aeruginosa]OFB75924.1 hypothetical protein AN471_07420 [Pseudomonas aeruginosa]HEH9514633.1 hypothetical protein [Pseudomonas aeruginosa]
MTESKICTCPSGDGSLRWPCPAHPAVEQAGGDERAAFERAFTVQEGIYFDGKRGEYRSMNLRAIEATDAQDLNLRLQGWQARAALAQPSPAQAEQAEAEAERPEVVARVDGADEDWFIQPEDETEMHNEGLLFAGCELGRMIDFDRIVGALRAENAKLSEALDRWPLIRDSLKLRLADALARVAELEGKLTDWVHEGFRLNEALAVAKAQHSVPDDDMILQIFADNAEHSEQGDEHGYCIVREQHAQAIARKLLAAAPGNSAQHSVPEGWKLVPLEAPVEMLRAGSIALGMEPLSDGSDGGYPITGQQSTIRQCYAAMLAAAPGKEVGHE